MNVIETSGLGKRYGGTWALRECTLAIPDGRVAALVGSAGEQGAGKVREARDGRASGACRRAGRRSGGRA